MSSALVSYIILTVLTNAEAQKETEVKIGTMQIKILAFDKILYSFWTFYPHFLAFT